MLARVKMLAAAVSVLIAALLASWLGGRNSAKQGELKDYAQTRKRMDAAPDGDDPAVLRDWLRERGKR